MHIFSRISREVVACLQHGITVVVSIMDVYLRIKPTVGIGVCPLLRRLKLYPPWHLFLFPDRQALLARARNDINLKS